VGDQEWFARLYRSYYRQLVLAAYALTYDIGEAEEIAQEAFAIAYGRRARVASAESPEAWLRTVAVNLARRRWRRRSMLDRILRRTEPPPPAEPAGDHLDLHQAIQALGDEHRAVVVLHYLADLPVDEVASILDIPVGTVKSRLGRARTALGAALGNSKIAEVDHA
jgi:RNA polymerase sigma-70 factor (ECF subfamily)